MKRMALLTLAGLLLVPSAYARGRRDRGIRHGKTSASDEGVYGWDIKCVNANPNGKALELRASQSDDDFYIEYSIDGSKEQQVWADPTQQYYSSKLKILLFSTYQIFSPGIDAALAVVRENTDGFGPAAGVFNLSDKSKNVDERYDLKCYVRYGTSEDNFDSLPTEFPPF